MRGEFLRRIASARMLWIAVVGFALGFLVRCLVVVDGSAASRALWTMVGVMVLAFGIFYPYCRRVDSTWGSANRR